MLVISYQLLTLDWAVLFRKILVKFNNSNDSRYLKSLFDLFDFNTNTICLNMQTLTLFLRILEFCEELELESEGKEMKNFLDKCKELYECYIKLSDLNKENKNGKYE